MFRRINDSLINAYDKSTPASATGLAVSGTCVFYGLAIKTDGVNYVSLAVCDGLTGSGAPLLPGTIKIDGASDLATISFDNGINCDNGIYVTASSVGAFTYQVYYDN